MPSQAPSYHGYRFPSEIISHAIWLYHRFALSFRDVEDLLGVKPIPSWNSPRLLRAYAAFFFDVVVSIFSSRFNASRSLGRCR